MEEELEEEETALGRVRVAIAFADLAGYTRFTEEEGEEEALGDYYGREVNLASRIVARARGGEVLVSDAVVDPVSGASNLAFEGIGQVKLKGFEEPHQLCRATLREEP
jgi:class 3 adenylate cyclase